MTVHVGEITSEVTDAARPETTAPAGAPGSPWAEREAQLTALERAARDRLRTATGHGDD